MKLRQDPNPPKSVAEAQAALQRAEEAEREREREQKRVAKEQEKKLNQLRAAAASEADRIEQRVNEALEYAAKVPTAAPLGRRAIVRGWLHGGLLPAATTPEMMPAPHRQAAQGDPGAVALVGVAEAAAGALQKFANPLNDGFLTGADEPVRRLDAAELRAWSAFVARVKESAGE